MTLQINCSETRELLNVDILLWMQIHFWNWHHTSMNQRESSEMEENKPQMSLNEKQQMNQELFIRCIAQPLGFSGNRLTAACIVYKCPLHWRSFEVEGTSTSAYNCIIQTSGHAIENILKAGSYGEMAPQRHRSSSTTLLGRMIQSYRATLAGVNLSLVNESTNTGVDTLSKLKPCTLPCFSNSSLQHI